MQEYDLYIPLAAKGKSSRTLQRLNKLKKKLTKHFGGLTYFPQRNEGLWRFGAVTFRDRVVILRVLSEDGRAARKFLGRLKAEIARDFDQQEVLIISRTVRAL